MDKAETNLGHGQRLDKLWTMFGQTLDKYWTLRPEFVRPLILQEHPKEKRGRGKYSEGERGNARAAPTLFQSLLKLALPAPRLLHRRQRKRERGREGDREYMKIDWHVRKGKDGKKVGRGE